MVRTELSGKRTATGMTLETLKAKTMKKYLSYLNLQPGDRIAIPKSNLRLVQHHAICIGADEYGDEWIAENKVGRGVQIVSADEFFSDINEITRIEPFNGTDEQRNNAIQYALALEGTDYNLLEFNCEHYANVVQHQQKVSNQVKTGILLGIVSVIVGLIISSNNKQN